MDFDRREILTFITMLAGNIGSLLVLAVNLPPSPLESLVLY